MAKVRFLCHCQRGSVSRKIIRSILDSVINMVFKWECVSASRSIKGDGPCYTEVAGIKVFAGVSGLFETGLLFKSLKFGWNVPTSSQKSFCQPWFCITKLLKRTFCSLPTQKIDELTFLPTPENTVTLSSPGWRVYKTYHVGLSLSCSRSHFQSDSELLSSLNVNQKIYFQITWRSVMRISGQPGGYYIWALSEQDLPLFVGNYF